MVQVIREDVSLLFCFWIKVKVVGFNFGDSHFVVEEPHEIFLQMNVVFYLQHCPLKVMGNQDMLSPSFQIHERATIYKEPESILIGERKRQFSGHLFPLHVISIERVISVERVSCPIEESVMYEGRSEHV